MNINNIMSAIEAKIRGIYPDSEVYFDLLPKGFVRPSFFLECVKEVKKDAGCALVRREVSIRTSCFVEANDYGDSSQAELCARAEGISELFSGGAFRVGDRALGLVTSTLAVEADLSHVTVVFSFMDEKQTADSYAPLIEQYQLSIKTGKSN